jgi:hypothetical protein
MIAFAIAFEDLQPVGLPMPCRHHFIFTAQPPQNSANRTVGAIEITW